MNTENLISIRQKYNEYWKSDIYMAKKKKNIYIYIFLKKYNEYSYNNEMEE
jgi:hypothetical protein